MGFSLDIDGQNLTMYGPAPHQQVVPYFQDYNPALPFPGTDLIYQSPTNVVGHQQRAFVIYWALRGFTELGFAPGIDLGGAGVPTPGCISVDLIATGETPSYGGSYDGVHIKADASKLENFGTNCFSSIVSNHLIEHLRCSFDATTQEQRKYISCSGIELLPVLHRWLALLKSGGYIAAITPDEQFMEEVNTSSLFVDKTHQHAFDSRRFQVEVLHHVQGARLLHYNELQNHFSFEFVLQKI